jgi:hypothetical protein
MVAWLGFEGKDGIEISKRNSSPKGLVVDAMEWINRENM